MWVSRCGHQQLWCSTAGTYKSLYRRQGGISPDLLFSQCLWAPGWGAQKKMWMIIGESRSPALGTEDSGNPKVFKPCSAVWGKGLDGFAWSQSFKLGKTGWNHREAGLGSKLERTGTSYHSQWRVPVLSHHFPIQSIFQSPKQVPTPWRRFLPQQHWPSGASPFKELLFYFTISPQMTALSWLLPLFTQCSAKW